MERTMEVETTDASTVLTQNENHKQLELDSRYLWIGGGTVIVLAIAPWLFFVTMLGVVLGFCSLEIVKERLQPLLRHHVKRKISEERNYDPLLHPHQTSVSTACRICNTNNCTHDSHQNRPRLKSSWSTSQMSPDLRIDPRLDAALARFCNAVFAEYVSPDWAPYETRLELKRALVKTLLTFGQGVKETFLANDEDSIIFVRQKVLPLFLFHVNSIREHRSITKEEQEECYNKVMALTKMLLQKYLNPEDAKCKLWTELVLAVLGSGVFWNLILLGREEIPILLREFHEESKMSAVSSGQVELAVSAQVPAILSVSSVAKENEQYVSLLLDSFLDPAKDVEQPSAISSRCRPTMSYVLKESDLLYCLIQFLKGEGALEWLQTLLEQDNSDPTSFPRKVIEIKHLNHFARSKVFLENLGFSRVEPAVEVDPELLYPATNTKSSNHTRSSSYGGGSSGVGLFDKKVVDGLALYPTPAVNQPIRSAMPGGPSAASALPSPPSETDSMFRRRDTLEPFIAKFYASLIQPDPESDLVAREALPEKKRVGTDAKARRRTSLKRFVVSDKPKDVLETLTSTVISLMRKQSPWKGVIGGWIDLLRPLLNEQLTNVLEKYTAQVLELDSILFLINLITDAFIESQDPELKKLKAQKQKLNTNASTTAEHDGNAAQILTPDWFLENLFDREDLLNTLCSYPDGILLFFVDLLDLLVSTLTSPTITSVS